MQTALARTWPRWARICERDDPEIYVRKVMLNTWSTWRRRRWRGEEASVTLPECPAPGDLASEVAERLAIGQALGKLTNRQRTVLVLRVFDDLSEAQVARVLDCAVGTVKSTLSQAVANALGTHPATSARPRSAEPHYYFDEAFGPRGGPTQDVVRSTSTGAVTAQRRCPGPQETLLGSIAATEHETFFMACLQFATAGRPTGTRLYRFALTRSGRITGFRSVPGGNLKGLRGGYLAASPDGTELAVGVAPARPGPEYAGTPSNIFVINTRTGKHAVWHATRLAGGTKFFFWDLSFAPNGQVLAAFGWAGCPETPTVRTCKSPGEMVAVNRPAAGAQARDRPGAVHPVLAHPRPARVDRRRIHQPRRRDSDRGDLHPHRQHDHAGLHGHR